jgi:hypothetical protein
VTIAIRPSWQGGIRKENHNFLKNGIEIFSRVGWTGIRKRRPTGKSVGIVEHEGGCNP